jgi:Domain of unknown function DUF29
MTQTSYDTDYYRWTQAQAEALRAKDWPALDVANLAEEIESLGKSDRRAVQSHLVVLVQHLLKWACQPQERARRGAGWQDSIDEARRQIELILRDSPSLRRELPDFLAWAYPHALRKVAREARLPLATFPEVCSWTPDQLQDEEFLPENMS